MTGDQVEAVKLDIDNTSALALIKNPVFHDKGKHIRIKYHFVRKAFEDGSISAIFVGTTDLLADIFTKPLGRVKFQELRSRIRMVQLDQLRKNLGEICCYIPSQISLVCLLDRVQVVFLWSVSSLASFYFLSC